MLNFKVIKDSQGQSLLLTSIYGKALLTIPQLNKGTAFTEKERVEFELVGKLPPHIETLEKQVKRAYLQFSSYEKGINRNLYLNYLLNVNQILFYKLLSEHTEEILPYIYTPGVGDAAQGFSRQFFQPRGIYISFEDQDRIEMILNNRTNPHLQIIVVSDGEGVLGIGDQGIGGMVIPVAKLMVYTAVGGVNPDTTLPILLDAGTNNENLLNDPMYLGWRHSRVTGKDYNIFINKFVQAVKKLFPYVFLHWEDFGSYNAYHNLAYYREKICSFNDDIQGTGVVTIAAILAALRQIGAKLKDQRIVVFGAGSAGMGITESIYNAMHQQNNFSEEEAKSKFWLVDRQGLLSEYSDNVRDVQKKYLRPKTEISAWQVQNPHSVSLQEVVENVHPTILIGCSGVGGAFNQSVVEMMARYVERPIIFPLSNPTHCIEATPFQIMEWTRGKALVATGSPFAEVIYQGKVYPANQCNNYLVFPGIGLGVIAVAAKKVSEGMLWAASCALSQSTVSETGRLLPTLEQVTQQTSRALAIAVARTAIDEGLAQIEIKHSVEEQIDQCIWKPHYLPYQRITENH